MLCIGEGRNSGSWPALRKGQIYMQPSFTPASKEKQAPASHEPGRVPSQVPSADLTQGLYKHPDSFITFKRAA